MKWKKFQFRHKIIIFFLVIYQSCVFLSQIDIVIVLKKFKISPRRTIIIGRQSGHLISLSILNEEKVPFFLSFCDVFLNSFFLGIGRKLIISFFPIICNYCITVFLFLSGLNYCLFVVEKK